MSAHGEPISAVSHGSMRRLRAKIAYRFYLLTMRFESMSFVPVRRMLLNIMLGRRHRNLNVFAHVYIEGYEGLRLGHDVSIHRWSLISAAGGLTIGDCVSIAHQTSILTANHGYSHPTEAIKYQPMCVAPVTIGANCWIGAKVCILAGVTIASGTVVAAGSVVTRSIADPDTIIGGIPARRIKKRI